VGDGSNSLVRYSTCSDVEVLELGETGCDQLHPLVSDIWVLLWVSSILPIISVVSLFMPLESRPAAV